MTGLLASLVLAGVLLALLLVVGFAVFCLVHLAGAGHVSLLPKVVWAILNVISPLLGGVLDLLLGRDR